MVGGSTKGYTLGGGEGFVLDHCVKKAIAEVADNAVAKEKPAAKRKKADQYLLTNFNVFCTEEPCVLCAMSLLHSRCGALFFLHQNPLFGGAGGLHHIHAEEGLNHHFPAYHYRNEALSDRLRKVENGN